MYIGIDVGGTNIRVARFEELDTSQYTQHRSFLITNNYEVDYSAITRTIDEMAINNVVDGIGIALPGTVDSMCTHLTKCAKINNWENQYIGEQLSDRYGCAVYLQNDAMVSALGEYKFGHGIDLPHTEDFVYIVWGTGIGATHIKTLNGKIVMSPMELGHTVLNKGGNRCRCGQAGCLQAYCSPLGVFDNYGKKMEDINEEEWGDIVNWFTQGTTTLSVLIRPSLIVFGSSVAINNPQIVNKIHDETKKALSVCNMPEFRISRLEASTGVVGAIALIAESSKKNVAF
jgi:glucokinase